MADGQVVFEISADGKKAMASINDVTDTIQKAGKKWESSAASASDSMQKSFTSAFNIERVKDWAIKAGQAVLDFARDAVQAASDLQEVQNVVDTTFGSSSGEIDRWAQDAIKQFGLTETKAKQFASTMGAMMKSSGVANGDIVEMSKSLAGLAADMASFYNMDFDTAFQKIRSGISGETEPLKQLGINMNVANLEAFALQQGIKKTFKEMTQGEQVMLRYQYLMQATADAQGDFAKTSDSFANSQRLLQSQFDALKTKIGDILDGPLAALTTWANTTLDKFINPSSTTVLDTFNNIRIDTEKKLGEIEAISNQANDLIAVLNDISSKKVEANGFATTVDEMASKLGILGTALTNAENNQYVSKLGEISSALEKKTGTSAGSWADFLTDIITNLPEAATQAGQAGDLTSFLSAAGEAADSLGGEAPGLWQSLLQTLGNEQAAQTLLTLTEAAGDITELKDAVAAAKQDKLSENISTIAGSLSLQTGIGENKWKEFLSTIINNLPEAAKKAEENGNIKGFLEAVGQAANELGGDAPALWQSLLDTLGEEGAFNALTGLQNVASDVSSLNTALGKAKRGNVVGALNDISNALALKTGTSPTKWSKFLTAISGHLGAVTDLTKNDTTTASLLTAIGKAADELGGSAPGLWKSLVDALGSDAAVEMVSTLSNAIMSAGTMGILARGANILNADAGSRWSGFVSAFDGLDGFSEAVNAAKANDYSGTISGLATALANTIGFTKDKWSTLLQEISNNLPAANEYTNGETVSDFLENAAEAAIKLGGEYPAMWGELIEKLGSDKAQAMVTALAGGQNAGTYLGLIAENANKLNASSAGHWSGVLTAIQKVTGSTFGTKAGQAKEKISQLAKALSGEDLNQTRAEAFTTLLTTLKDDAESLTGLAGTDAKGVSAFLENLATAANKLEPDDAEGWNTLITALATGFSGGLGTKDGETFFTSLSESFLALGNKSEVATAGLKAMGYSEEEIAMAQADWLATCQQLVKTIPTLSGIIDETTGAIEGGTEALQEHVDEWKRMQEAKVLWAAYYAKEAALAESENSIPTLRITAGGAKHAVERIRKELIESLGNETLLDFFAGVTGLEGLDDEGIRLLEALMEDQEAFDNATEKAKKYKEAIKAADDAEAELKKQSEANAEAEQQLADEREYVEEVTGEYAEAAKKAVQATDGLTQAQIDAATAAQKQASAIEDAMKAVEDYVKSVRETTEREVEGIIKGFKEIETPAEKAAKEAKDLEEQLKKAEGDAKANLELQVSMKWGEVPTIENMKAGLVDQLKYMTEYQKYLEAAKERGVSAEILSALSDGSQESFDYLKELAEGKGDIDKLNALYKAVEEERQKFTDTLTASKLETDSAFDELLQKANETIAGLDQSEEAKLAAESTMAGLLEGLKSKNSEISEQVDNILAIIGRLSAIPGFSFLGTKVQYGVGTGGASKGVGGAQPTPNAIGNDYVPFDGYFAVLHEGEAILNAEEARVWRGFQSGYNGSRNIDYDALGGLMRDNVHAGGNVYLDGKTVGRVISDIQGNSYRALERSGWQQ